MFVMVVLAAPGPDRLTARLLRHDSFAPRVGCSVRRCVHATPPSVPHGAGSNHRREGVVHWTDTNKPFWLYGPLWNYCLMPPSCPQVERANIPITSSQASQPKQLLTVRPE